MPAERAKSVTLSPCCSVRGCSSGSARQLGSLDGLNRCKAADYLVRARLIYNVVVLFARDARVVESVAGRGGFKTIIRVAGQRNNRVFRLRSH